MVLAWSGPSIPNLDRQTFLHNRLPLHVERSVQQDRNARNRIKFLEQSIKTFVLVLSNSLHARGTVNVNDCWDFVPPLQANAFDEQHEWGLFISFKNFRCPFSKNDRRERSLLLVTRATSFFDQLNSVRS